MLIAELKNRQNLLLKESVSYIFTLYASSKREVKEIEELLALNLDEPDERFNNYNFLFIDGITIDMVGNISEVKEKHLEGLIPLRKKHTLKGLEYGDKDEIINEHVCYCGKDYPNNNIILHEDKLSSFNCACQKLQIVYFIVLKERRDGNSQSRNT